MPKTIKAITFFGKEKEVTKQEFANLWVEQASNLRRLSSKAEWQQEVNIMIERVRDQAHKQFDFVFTKQNKEELSCLTLVKK